MRDDQRLILVLNGLRYPQYNNDYFPNIKRADEAARLMEMAFREFRRYPISAADQVVGQAPVLGGKEQTRAGTRREGRCRHDAGRFPCRA